MCYSFLLSSFKKINSDFLFQKKKKNHRVPSTEFLCTFFSLTFLPLTIRIDPKCLIYASLELKGIISCPETQGTDKTQLPHSTEKNFLRMERGKNRTDNTKWYEYGGQESTLHLLFLNKQLGDKIALQKSKIQC